MGGARVLYVYCALCASHMTGIFMTQSSAHVLRLNNPPWSDTSAYTHIKVCKSCPVESSGCGLLTSACGSD